MGINDNFSEQAGAEAFNPERAAEMRARVDQRFRNAQRKIDRITYLNQFVAIVVAWVAGYCFMTEAQTTRGIVGCGLVVLVALEHTILIKLWYWIANNKVNTLYELRMLRLDMINPGKADDVEPQGYQLKQRVSWPWLAAIILVGTVGGAIVAHNTHFHGTMTSDRTVKIAADGQAMLDTLYSLENTTDIVFQDYSIYTGGEISEIQYLSPDESPLVDDQGNGIPATVVPAGCNHRFDFHLNKPVMPRERFAVRWKDKTVEAELKDGVWEFKISQNWSYRHSYYRDTVTLPAGAKLVSVEPQDACVVDKDGATMVIFSGVRRNGARWEYSIKYALP